MTQKTEAFDFRVSAERILADAERSVARAHLAHYEAAGGTEIRDRLKMLYDLIVRSMEERRLAPMIAYGESLARERYNAGFDLSEVQCVMNVLEEAIWKRIMTDVPPSELALDLGLVSTVLGAAKDALAREYVSLASHRNVASLNQDALFEPRGGGPDAEWQ